MRYRVPASWRAIPGVLCRGARGARVRAWRGGFSLRLAACRRVRYFLLVLQVTYAVLTSGGGGGMA